MGAGGASLRRLPSCDLDRAAVQHLAGPMFDEQRFEQCVTEAGTLPREVMEARFASMLALREASGLSDDPDAKLAALERAVDADPSFLVAAQGYATALAKAGRGEEAAEVAAAAAARLGSEAVPFAQVMLVNAGAARLTAATRPARWRFSRARTRSDRCGRTRLRFTQRR